MSDPSQSTGGMPDDADPVDPSRAQEGRIDEAAESADVEEQLRSQGVRIGRGGITPAVFWPAFVIIAGVTIVAILFPSGTSGVLNTIQTGITEGLGWYYMIVVAAFIVFAVWMGLSRFGNIKLGREDEPPAFGVWSWFAMLFAAGMGIGLVFFGLSEPLTFATSDPKPGTDGSAAEVAQLGMAQAFVHWGLHPWGVYAVIGLALAYAIHRRGRPVSIRWALEPLFGERVKGWVGDLIDVLAIIGTIFGVATSLGLGVQQIAAGLSAMGVLGEANNTILVVLIVIITLLATASVISGLGRGIKWLSNINLSLMGVLLIAVLVLGPTLFLLRDFVQSLGIYLANVLDMTFDAAAYTGDAGQEWLADWTIFYWGWWMAWAPFVGVFIARISRGRTIRQFIAGVLLVPTLLGFVWLATLGGTGIYQQLYGQGGLVDPDEGVIAEEALFLGLDHLPLGMVLSVIAVVLVAIFFITSSDSASLVVDMLASGGHPDPPTWSRVLWAALEGLIAIGLLLAGSTSALQAGSIATALPFSIVLILMCFATYRALNAEHRHLLETERRLRRRELAGELSHDFDEHFGRQVDDRIDYALTSTAGIWNREGKHNPVSTLSRSRRRGRGGQPGTPGESGEGGSSGSGDGPGSGGPGSG